MQTCCWWCEIIPYMSLHQPEVDRRSAWTAPKIENWVYSMMIPWQTDITMEHHHFQWVNQLYMAIFNSYVSLPEGNGPKMFFHVGFAELCKLGRGITAEYSSNLGLYTQENWHSWGYKWGELYKHMAKKRTSVQISAYVYTHIYIYIHMHKPQLLQL